MKHPMQTQQNYYLHIHITVWQCDNTEFPFGLDSNDRHVQMVMKRQHIKLC